MKDLSTDKVQTMLRDEISPLAVRIAHDLQSPAMSLQWYLKQRSGDEESHRIAVECADLLMGVIEQISELSTLRSFEKDRVSSKSLIANSGIERATRKKNIKLNLLYDKDVPLNLDGVKISAAIKKIVEKELQYFTGEDQDPRIELKIDLDGKDLKIFITSNAKKGFVGVQKDGIDSLLKNSKGLELHYSRMVVEGHGGNIAARSEDGRNSISITLPDCVVKKCYEGDKKVMTKNSVSNVSRDDSYICTMSNEVLVVDDDIEMILQWNDLITEKLKKTAITASSPEEVFRLDVKGCGITMGIVDYYYEGSRYNGLDVAEYLRKQGVEVIHLCVEREENRELISELAEGSVTSIVSKPLNKSICRDIIR